MGRRKKKKADPKAKAKVHKKLEGLDITINEFGEIESNIEIKKINKFLNRNVEDKKLAGRDIEHLDERPEELEMEKKKKKKKKKKSSKRDQSGN